MFDKEKWIYYNIITSKRKSLSASQVLAAPPQIDFFITYTQTLTERLEV